VVAEQYALADLGAAQERMASGAFFGKLVVRP
jgi:NADPH:quinone reductase-like Zn-dependent oxidoreductase